MNSQDFGPPFTETSWNKWEKTNCCGSEPGRCYSLTRIRPRKIFSLRRREPTYGDARMRNRHCCISILPSCACVTPPAGPGRRCATIFHYFSGNRGRFYPVSPSPINPTIRDGRSAHLRPS